MSRRQALGALSTNSCNTVVNLQPNQINKQPLRATASTKAYGNENKQPFAPSQTLLTSSTVTSALAKAKPAAKASDFEFEIFQEDILLENKDCQSAKCQDADIIPKSFNKENEKLLLAELEANEEEDDEDDYEDYDDYEEDEEDDEENVHLPVDEEEGISRLNMAAITDTLSNDELNKENTTSLAMMMDSSSINHDLSPMILDDTIKFQSQSRLSVSHILDDEGDDEEQSEEIEDENEICDEETERQQLLLDQENMLMSCLEYKDDILAYMREAETKNRPKANYMSKQQDINSSMRSILVDWLVEVCEEYRLHSETLYNAVNYTDRFLSHMSVLRGKLQLVGTASMYIASKYEEITPPDVSEFVYITDDTYTKKQVLRMEHLLLKVLDFKMTTPTANVFLMHYLRFAKQFISNDHKRVECLSKYLAELTLIDSETFIHYLPSQIAASAFYLALTSLGKPWTKQIAETLGYAHDLSELKSCIADMYKAMQQAPKSPQQAIFEKYKQSKYEQVSLITLPRSSLPSSIFQ